MKIYLIGYMASGKTNLGREMAAISGFGFADLDELFEEKYRVSILSFFEQYGETLFRQLEQQVLHETAAMEDVIISTGGGTPCFFDNMDFILKHGRAVYLKMPVPFLAARLSTVHKKRPLLKDIPDSAMEAHIEDQMKEREHFYLRANLVADGPDFNAAEILEKIMNG